MQRVKVGDLVQVIAGKEKGKRGTIKRILKGGDRVIVDGLNIVVRHTRPTQQGGSLDPHLERDADRLGDRQADPSQGGEGRGRKQGPRVRVEGRGAEAGLSDDDDSTVIRQRAS